MQPGYEVRVAQNDNEDMEALRIFGHCLYDYPMDELKHSRAREDLADKWYLRMAKRPGTTTIALKDGKIVAASRVTPDPSGDIDRETDTKVHWTVTCVMPDHRGRGLSTPLRKRVLDAVDPRAVRVVKSRVADDNPKSWSVAEKLGYQHESNDGKDRIYVLRLTPEAIRKVAEYRPDETGTDNTVLGGQPSSQYRADRHVWSHKSASTTGRTADCAGAGSPIAKKEASEASGHQETTKVAERAPMDIWQRIAERTQIPQPNLQAIRDSLGVDDEMAERIFGRMEKAAAITLDIEKGDTLLFGRFKNNPHTVETIGTDSKGQPTVNGMKLLACRIEKKMPGKTKEAADELSPEARATAHAIMRMREGSRSRFVDHYLNKAADFDAPLNPEKPGSLKSTNDDQPVLKTAGNLNEQKDKLSGPKREAKGNEPEDKNQVREKASRGLAIARSKEASARLVAQALCMALH